MFKGLSVTPFNHFFSVNTSANTRGLWTLKDRRSHSDRQEFLIGTPEAAYSANGGMMHAQEWFKLYSGKSFQNVC